MEVLKEMFGPESIKHSKDAGFTETMPADVPHDLWRQQLGIYDQVGHIKLASLTFESSHSHRFIHIHT